MPLFPTEASSVAQGVDLLFLFMVLVSGGVVTLIFGLIIFFAVKYRRRSDDEVGAPISGSTRLELAWTLIPLGAFMIPFIWGAWLYLQMAKPPTNAEPVYVVAKQWMWKFEHASGQSEINELHVPVDRNIKLTMVSQDVIHSFFVPDFRIKQDVLPDRYTTTWFRATQIGTYRLECAQYCGTNHSLMTGSIIVMSQSDYAAWLAGGVTAQQSPAQVGANLFQQYGCSGCHHADGSGPAPSLVGVFGHTVHLSDGSTVIADENYVRESILSPRAKIVAGYQPIMPSFQGRLSEEQILQLIAYIRSLGSQTGPSAQPQPPVTSSAVPGATPGVVPTGTPPLPTTAAPTSAPTSTSTTVTPVAQAPRPSNPGGPGPALNLKGDPTRGAQVFTANCASCHGDQGKGGVDNPGSTDGTVPSLNPVDPALVSQDPKVFAYNLDLFIEHGSTPEGSSPQLLMPAWGDKKLLTPQQIADVIAYIMSLNGVQP
jgi:cytochrome c oxidase subunit II